uniref:Putative secreted protein n=1 Tax=Anopheles marajoara TaxID=58244 RepID=A0A2M4C692_9DIPT
MSHRYTAPPSITSGWLVLAVGAPTMTQLLFCSRCSATLKPNIEFGSPSCRMKLIVSRLKAAAVLQQPTSSSSSAGSALTVARRTTIILASRFPVSVFPFCSFSGSPFVCLSFECSTFARTSRAAPPRRPAITFHEAGFVGDFSGHIHTHTHTSTH